MKVLSYFCQSQNVTREKLREALSYKKGTRKMLMKLTPGMLDQKKILYKIFYLKKTELDLIMSY